MANIATNTDTAKIFLTDYASYNEGTQFEFGHWIDLTDFNDAEELFEYITKHFEEADKKSPLECGGTREELMITDFENFPEELYNESMSFKDFENIYKYIEVTENLDTHIVEAFISLFGIEQIEDIENRFYMDLSDSNNINYDFGYEMAEQGVIEIPDHIYNYFDFESYGRDCLYDFAEENGVIFLNN